MITVRLILFLFLLPLSSMGQMIEGELLNSKRKLVTPYDFKLPFYTKGELYFDLSVDITGKVVDARFIQERATTNSTPARIEATKKLKTLKFEAGTYFPKHHHVIVKVTLVPSATKIEVIQIDE